MNFMELGLGGTLVNYEPGHDYSVYPVLGFRTYITNKSDFLVRLFVCPAITQAKGTIHCPFGISLGTAFN